MPPIPMQGIRSAITPGVFDGLILALQQYGTKSFAEVAAPAIEYAEQAFPCRTSSATCCAAISDIIALWPDSRKFFYPDGALDEARRDLPRADPGEDPARAGRRPRRRRTAIAGETATPCATCSIKAPSRSASRDFNEKNGGLIAYDDHGQSFTPRRTSPHGNVSRLRGPQAGLLDAGSGDDRSSEYPGRLRSEVDGPQQPASICTRWSKP